MARFPLAGFPRCWSRGATTALTAALCLMAAGCASSDNRPPPAPADEKPMVAPTASPPSQDFNLQVAKPLTNPPRPAFSPVPVIEAPPPPATLAPLTAPDPVALETLPAIAQPAPAPQRGTPIPPPPGAPGDTVSALEAQSAAAAPPAPTPAKPSGRQQASLPAPARGATTAAADATFRLLYAPEAVEPPDGAPPVLERLAKIMAQDQELRLKLNAFASGSANDPVAARKLSLQRALKLRAALTALGVSSLRVDVLALGMTATEPPADRIDIVPANPATATN